MPRRAAPSAGSTGTAARAVPQNGLRNDDGGVSLYSDSKRKEMIAKMQSTILSGIDAMSQDSFHRLLQTTNVQTGATPAAANSRRYKTYEVSNEKAGVQTPETKAYFDGIAAVSAHAFALFLDTRDISAWLAVARILR